MGRALFLLLCVTGCFSKPEFTGGTDARTDGVTGDGDRDGATDGPPGGCMITESFNDLAAAPCGTWGTFMDTGMAQRDSGTIRITSDSGENGYCETTSAHEITGGAVIEVATILAGAMPGDEVYLEVLTLQGWVRLHHTQTMEAGPLVPVLELRNGGHGGTLLGTNPYNAGAMRFWRLQPTAIDQITASTSPDGAPSTWATLGVVVVANAMSATRVRFGARGAADTAAFDVDSFSVCP